MADIYHAVFGTIFTGSAGLLFALINPSSTYWAFGFPAAVISVFGADFVFAAGTIFVAKVALPHEQSLAGSPPYYALKFLQPVLTLEQVPCFRR